MQEYLPFLSSIYLCREMLNRLLHDYQYLYVEHFLGIFTQLWSGFHCFGLFSDDLWWLESRKISIVRYHKGDDAELTKQTQN